MRRAALACIQSVVNKENVQSIVDDIMLSIDELEFGIEEIEEPADSAKEETKSTSASTQPKVDNESEKLDEEDDNQLEPSSIKRVKRSFSDSDKSYRDLQIKTVLKILIDNDYDIVNGDFQW